MQQRLQGPLVYGYTEATNLCSVTAELSQETDCGSSHQTASMYIKVIRITKTTCPTTLQAGSLRAMPAAYIFEPFYLHLNRYDYFGRIPAALLSPAEL